MSIHDRSVRQVVTFLLCRVGLAALMLAGLVAAPAADAQYFGRNKVQWRQFDFRVLKTRHFEVHCYPPNNPTAEDTARLAERWYARLSGLFHHEFTERKPIILYNSSLDFQQTTVTEGLIGEGVGGFTEPYQDRLVMPLTGDLADTDHVLGHELVHEFQFDIVTSLSRRARTGGYALQQLPLWMIEGQAEYLSLGRVHAQTAMWLRDAVIHDELPTMRQLTNDARFFPYRWGHAFWAYVGGRWGDAAVVEVFLSSLRRGPEKGIKAALGVSAQQVFHDWHEAIKHDVEPIISAGAPANTVARLVVAHRHQGGGMNLAPVLSPDGRRVAFLSTRGVFAVELFLADAATGKIERTLLSAARNPHLDALRFIDSSGSFSPDGRTLAFVVGAKGSDQIGLVDADSGRLIRNIRPHGVDAVSNPVFSPDGRRIAFSGSTEGRTALYLVDAEDGATTPLTDERFAALAPAWSPDGKTIAYVCDRGPGTDPDTLAHGPMQVCLLDVATRQPRVLTLFDRAEHTGPQFSPDGAGLYFIADPDGVPNLYRYTFTNGAINRVTNVSTGVSGITDLSPAFSVAARSGEIAFSVFERRGYDVYVLPATGAAGTPLAPGFAPILAAATLPPVTAKGQQLVDAYLADFSTGLPPKGMPEETSYRPKLGLDYVGSVGVGLGVDTYGVGVEGAVSAYFSDMLGEHQLGVTLQGGAASGYGGLGNTLGGQVSYLNRANRFNWGAQVTHVPYLTAATAVGEEVVDVNGRPTAMGVVQQLRDKITVDQARLLGLYPFSLTRRLEASATSTRLSYASQLETVLVLPDGSIYSDTTENLPAPPNVTFDDLDLAYVFDNSFYGFASPWRGSRYRLEVGTTFGTFRYNTLLADYRRYVFLGPFSLAMRALHFGRYGGDAENPELSPLYLGQETLVRGYDVSSFDLTNCTGPATPTTTGCPQFDRLLGSRIAVGNLELRTQVLGTEELGLLNFPYVPTELTAFLDAGAAWSRGQSVKLRFDRTTSERVPVVSAGLAVRFLLGYVPFELYYAHPFQLPGQNHVWGLLITPGF